MEYQYDAEGLKVIIVDQVGLSDPAMKGVHINAILMACSYKEITQHFPKLTFIIEECPPNKDIDNIAEVFEEDIAEGRHIIHVYYKNVVNAISQTEEDKIKVIAGYIVHEITHCWQMMLSSAQKKSWIIAERLEKQVEKFPEDLGMIRRFLNRFITLLQCEGLARYNEKFIRELIKFDEQMHWSLYKDAYTEALKILESWFIFLKIRYNPALKTKSFEAFDILFETLRAAVYTIGPHMVYTIIYVEDTPLEKLAKMDYLEFVNKYEECILQKKQKPVVTLTNEEGLLVYNKMLKDWWNLIQNIRE